MTPGDRWGCCPPPPRERGAALASIAPRAGWPPIGRGYRGPCSASMISFSFVSRHLTVLGKGLGALGPGMGTLAPGRRLLSADAGELERGWGEGKHGSFGGHQPLGEEEERGGRSVVCVSRPGRKRHGRAARIDTPHSPPLCRASYKSALPPPAVSAFRPHSRGALTPRATRQTTSRSSSPARRYLSPIAHPSPIARHPPPVLRHHGRA